MNNVRIMKIKDGLGQLVDNVLFVPFLQVFVIAILPYQGMQINVHVFEDKVNIFIVLGPDYVIDFDDVFLFELFEEHDFTVGSLGIGGVGEGIKVLFEGFELFCLAVSHFPYDSIGSTSDFLYWLIQGEYMRLYFV